VVTATAVVLVVSVATLFALIYIDVDSWVYSNQAVVIIVTHMSTTATLKEHQTLAQVVDKVMCAVFTVTQVQAAFKLSDDYSITSLVAFVVYSVFNALQTLSAAAVMVIQALLKAAKILQQVALSTI